VVENFKKRLFLAGRRQSDLLRECTKDLVRLYHINFKGTSINLLYFQFKLCKPNATMFSKKHDILPFEDIAPVEQLCRTSDTSIFFFSSSNKKRPNSLILGKQIIPSKRGINLTPLFCPTRSSVRRQFAGHGRVWSELVPGTGKIHLEHSNKHKAVSAVLRRDVGTGARAAEGAELVDRRFQGRGH
jgi:hypothetical protein